MATRIGLNGFGRIGRYVARLLADSDDLILTAVNDLADKETLALLLRHDSVHGPFPHPVSTTEKGLLVNGREIAVTCCATGHWDWTALGVDIVVECTGTIKDRAGLMKHIECGAKKVVVSASVPDPDASIVMGVNHGDYKASFQVLSCTSCTTNCLAPAAKVIHENFGIRHGLMTTIHSYTMNQRLLDGSHKDPRRARAAAMSMIPTSTGADKAIAVVYPALKGKLHGLAVRVPTPDVSLVDLTCELERDTDAPEVNAVLKAAAEGPLRENMGYSEEPLVSVDYTGSTYGGVVDSLLTTVMDRRMLKLILWYDNESGYSNQLVRLVRLAAD